MYALLFLHSTYEIYIHYEIQLKYKLKLRASHNNYYIKTVQNMIPDNSSNFDVLIDV